LRESSSPAAQKCDTRRFAAATRSGVLVDLHFGKAEEFYIYDSDGADVRFIEKRSVSRYCTGSFDCGDKESRWTAVLAALADCSGVFALRIGDSPAEKLKNAGITAVATYERVETAVRNAAAQSEFAPMKIKGA
jgi:predicted Fe-Mo cluster-binding NifX family protein